MSARQPACTFDKRVKNTFMVAVLAIVLLGASGDTLGKQIACMYEVTNREIDVVNYDSKLLGDVGQFASDEWQDRMSTRTTMLAKLQRFAHYCASL